MTFRKSLVTNAQWLLGAKASASAVLWPLASLAYYMSEMAFNQPRGINTIGDKQNFAPSCRSLVSFNIERPTSNI